MDSQKLAQFTTLLRHRKLCHDIVAMFFLQLCYGLHCYVAIVFCAFFLNYVVAYFENVATELG